MRILEPNCVTVLFVLFLGFAALARSEQPAGADPSNPNVVLIFADDLGYGDLGCYGATKVQTPNIDRLAKEGRRFVDAHSASAVCTPSRYALLTGEYPVRTNGGKGVWGPAPVTSGLIIDTDKLTIADVFKSRGYATAALGKWHLGFGEGTNNWQEPLRPGPQDLGFDYYFGLPVVNSAPPYVYVENDRVVGGDPADPLIYIGRGRHAEATPITRIPPEASQRTANMFKGAVEAHRKYNDYTVGTVLANKAVDWITANKQQPFFLYLATTHIHHPFTPGKQFQGTSDAELYGDFIQELDWMVGEVTDCLDKQGLSENTLVIFTSDNGGMLNLGGRNAVRAGHRMNGDLLGFKFGTWEGGHRVPFIARWPGKIEPGTESAQLICNVDMLATFTALTGQDIQTLEDNDSVNMLPALIDEPTSPLRKELVLAAHKPTHLAVRKGKWLYIGAKGSGGFRGSKPQDHAWGGPPAVQFVGGINSDIENGRLKEDAPPAQLYDLEADVNQTRNLHDELPEVVKEMSALLTTYAPPKRIAAPRKGKADATKGAAKRIAATPSSRSVSFDFESGKLEPWKVVVGEFRHIVGNRDSFFHNKGEYNKQGDYYLTTLETSATAERGADQQTGVIVSPLFIPKGGEMTFRVGGGDGPATYVALCMVDGTEVQRARGVNGQVMQKANWDLAPFAGKKMFIKIVDKATVGWGHITADNFQFDAEVLAKYPEMKTLTVTYSIAKGIGAEKDVMRRDPSDIIKVGDLYYVWYSKGEIAPGYDATVWYATSPDGHTWTEEGMALAKGELGSWDGESVFTPNILVAEGRYWLFYTGTSRKFSKPFNPDSKIGIAVSDSPDGPWERLASNPALKNSDNREDFDSHLIDDACLIVRDGKYWFYYKGRQLGKSPAQTKLGLAIADKPQGPYKKHPDNPIIPGNHEVLVWPQGTGVAAMIGTTGPKDIVSSIFYAEDGLRFSKTHNVVHVPHAAGAYRPEAFTDSDTGKQIDWGVHIGKQEGFLPFIQRFELTKPGGLIGNASADAGKPSVVSASANGGFSDDLEFLETHTPIVLLENEGAAVAVAPAYQGRVMTSTVDRQKGAGFGWINRPAIARGVFPMAERKGKLEEHIHIFGGEERFWLGPEGGQFALYFKPGAKFAFSNWVVPAVIDTEPFELVEQTGDKAVFARHCALTNYSGTVLTMGIERTVRLLDRLAVEKMVGGKLASAVRCVAYETDNRLTNRGKNAWTPETGLPSIWVLGMFNPSPRTTVVIPFESGSEEELGPKVSDTYFGKVPPEYLRVEDDILFFKGDGTHRSKIGISPQRSKGIAGSYDANGRVLTLVTYNVQNAPSGFVNSMWELQKEPYKGDVINSYNDGSPEPGKPPLGPFYEIETSSPAAALKPGETMKHVQRTLHLEGPEDALDPVARRMLGIGLKDIKMGN